MTGNINRYYIELLPHVRELGDAASHGPAGPIGRPGRWPPAKVDWTATRGRVAGDVASAGSRAGAGPRSRRYGVRPRRRRPIQCPHRTARRHQPGICPLCPPAGPTAGGHGRRGQGALERDSGPGPGPRSPGVLRYGRRRLARRSAPTPGAGWGNPPAAAPARSAAARRAASSFRQPRGRRLRHTATPSTTTPPAGPLRPAGPAGRLGPLWPGSVCARGQRGAGVADLVRRRQGQCSPTF
jgi:hypothetical protein